MIIWGGLNNNGEMNTGGRYKPATDSWTSTDRTTAPPARAHHVAVWTGPEMIVWGSAVSTGAKYSPANDGTDDPQDNRNATMPTQLTRRLVAPNTRILIDVARAATIAIASSSAAPPTFAERRCIPRMAEGMGGCTVTVQRPGSDRLLQRVSTAQVTL